MSLPSFISTRLARYDIDARQLATLVTVYLKQDLRGGRAFMQFGAREYVRGNMALLTLLGMYVLTGALIGMMAFSNVDALHFSIIIHTFTLLIVALAMLAESGNVIFNESEADILGHLPLSSRTYFAAKVLNLFLFTSLLAAAANLFPAIFGVWAVGANLLFLPAHALAALLDGLLATTLIVTSYGLLMRLVGRERFDSIIAYSQIVLVLVFMFGFQILPRVMDINVVQMARGFRWYYLLYPPAWFAGVTLVLMGKLHLYALALASIGVATLIVLGQVALRKVGSDYSSFVARLTYGETPAKQRNHRASVSDATARGLFERLKLVWLVRPAERAVFDLVSTYLRRNREVKVRLYPSLAYFVFVPVLSFFSEGLPDPFARHMDAYSLMGALMVCYVTLTSIEVLRFSEHYAAAYIFRVAPVARLGDIYSGFRKAVMVWVALPGFAILFALYTALWRSPAHAALLLIPWAIITPAVIMIGFLFRETLPLARKYQKGQQTSRNVFLFFACFVLLSIFGALQAAAIRGHLPIVDLTFPYWLFIIVSVGVSLLFFIVLRALTGEAATVAPADADQ